MAPDSPAPPAPLPLSLEAYRLLFEGNPHAMLLFEVGTWRILAANEAAALLYGWSTAELLSMSLVELRPPEDVERFVRAALAIGSSMTRVGTVRHRARDGHDIMVDITTAGVGLDDGRQARLSVITDVTGAHQLQQTRDRLASVVAGSHDAIIVTDLRGRVQAWNPGAERMFGYTEREMQGRSIGQVHPPTAGPTFREMVGDVVAGRAVRMFDAVGRHKDGHDITISMTLSPICDAEGEVIGVSGIERDVTTRRAAEQTLRESQARFARIFHSGLILAAIIDVEGQTIRDVNESLLRFFGLKRQELIGASIHGFDEMWLDLAARSRLFAAWDARKPIQAIEMGFQTRSGPKYALLSVLPGDTAGEDIVMMVDVTERRRLEHELSEARRLEALGRLAGGVAHDFNNMLSVIGGYADLLEEQMPADSQWRADLGEIRRAAERAAHLTRQLLAFGRRQMLQPRTIDLNDVVRRNETFLTRLLGETMTLRISLLDEPLWVEADTAQIEQVLLNLASNARDAVDDGAGVLQIVTRTRMLARSWAQERGLPPGRVAEIAVRDTGRGMSPETLQRIFEPFFTTKEVGEGTGLGLATVYGIVKQSGGHIDAASTPGQGTLFRILLPLVTPPDEGARTAEEPRAAGGTETILLVEDERAVARLAEALLTRLGYRVLTAESANEALRVAEAHPAAIDLVLTDVVMPGASGRVLIEQLRQTRPDIRAVYMSGYPADSIVRYGVQEGAVPFLPKPFTMATLAKKVREALS